MTLTIEIPDKTMCAVLSYTYSEDDQIAVGVSQYLFEGNKVTSYGMDYNEGIEDEMEDDEFPEVPFYDRPTFRRHRR